MGGGTAVKDIPYYCLDWRVIHKKGVENIDWRGDWECTAVMDVGRGQEVHSCVGDSGNVRCSRRW